MLLHSLRLMLLSWVSIPKHHVDLGMAQHRSQRHKINARLSRPRRPSVAKIVEAERRNLAVSHCSVMRIVDLRNWLLRVVSHAGTDTA